MADHTVTPANVQQGANAKLKYGTAGAAIIAGQAVYLDPTDNTYKLADHDSATAAVRDVAGIAVNSAPGAGQPITVCEYDDDFTPGFTIANGVGVYLSGTAGGLCPFADLATGDYPKLIMMGIGSDKVVLNAGSRSLKSATAL